MSTSDDNETVRFQLCSRISTCCPDVVIDSDTVVIEDDNGGRVELTRTEFEHLLDKSRDHLK